PASRTDFREGGTTVACVRRLQVERNIRRLWIEPRGRSSGKVTTSERKRCTSAATSQRRQPLPTARRPATRWVDVDTVPCRLGCFQPCGREEDEQRGKGIGERPEHGEGEPHVVRGREVVLQLPGVRYTHRPVCKRTRRLAEDHHQREEGGP